MTFQATLIRCCLVGSVSRIEYNATRDETRTMKKPSKTAAELEASIKVEMEDICDWPTDMTISVQPDGGRWRLCKKDRETTPIVAKWSSRSLRGSELNMI
jgi:hypothetical protein